MISVQVLQSLSVFSEDDLDLAVEELNDVSYYVEYKLFALHPFPLLL